MESFFGTVQTLFLCGTLLAISFVVLLALPNCELRSFLMPIVGWAMAIFCGLYALSPVDIVPEALLGPFGLVDDAAAVITGIAAAQMAMKAKGP